ncbi:MAG: SDR family NAD(P)-dependent oxidoreductase [Pseudomonadota bacterium]
MPRKTALITGASAGLGVEFARQLAARDMNLILTARRKDRLDAVADELRRDTGVHVTTFASDLADPAAPAELERAVAEHGLRVDYLVNNAGASGPHLLEDRDWEANRAFFNLMMVSVAELCHRFVPSMVDRGWGRVINVSSMAGRIVRSAGGNYGPTKAYVIALSEELALMTQGTGVHVSALCPGFTHTEFHAAGGLDEMKARMPTWLWYDADVVVADGIKAADAGQAVAISGRLYRWADPIARSPLIAPLVRRSNR